MYEMHMKGNRSKLGSAAFSCCHLFFHAGIRSFQKKNVQEVLWDRERKVYQSMAILQNRGEK